VILDPSQIFWNVPLTVFEIPLIHGDLYEDPKSNGTVPLRTIFRLIMFRLARVDCTPIFPGQPRLLLWSRRKIWFLVASIVLVCLFSSLVVEMHPASKEPRRSTVFPRQNLKLISKFGVAGSEGQKLRAFAPSSPRTAPVLYMPTPRDPVGGAQPWTQLIIMQLQSD
jgi:hypothetical protein